MNKLSEKEKLLIKLEGNASKLKQTSPIYDLSKIKLKNLAKKNHN